MDAAIAASLAERSGVIVFLRPDQYTLVLLHALALQRPVLVVLRLSVVVPILMRRQSVAHEALRHMPLFAAAGAARVRLEGVPYRETAGCACPAIVRAGGPVTLWTIDLRRHVASTLHSQLQR